MKPKIASFSFPNAFARKVHETFNRLWNFAGALLLMGLATHAHAGGGGENMLLIVNPNDEPSLRIANAYVQARHIPVNNILYFAPLTTRGYTLMDISPAQFTSNYQSAVPAAIAVRGLTNQIDYIGTIGQPIRVIDVSNSFSLQDCLNQLTQFQHGLTVANSAYRTSELYSPQTASTFPYIHGTNTAIHHSIQYPATGASGTANYAQWYMSGMIAHAGFQGMTTTQAIQNLQRTIAGDGAKPVGTVYFERSNDPLRTGARSPFWPAVESYMAQNSIPFIEESLNNGYIAVPTNRRDVMGAEIGAANYSVPNGSVYLPGSWADSLTSYGAVYPSNPAQTLANNVLLSGAGGSSGTVVEPGADSDRFPTAALSVYSYDGSTLGEAFYKTVVCPDLIMLQGDILSQPFADIPVATYTSSPIDGATISGSVSLSGSACLTNLTSQSTAARIANLRLFVDGVDTGASVTGPIGSFILDTTALTDGFHEVRLVAYNNSAAASEGCVIRNYQVANLGQSVAITGSSSYAIGAAETVSLPVSATQGSGLSISGIQLQSLGRVVGSITGLSGGVSLSGTSLAYGDNTITPVALLSSGQQIQGPAITVTRRFQPIPGRAPTSVCNRKPGFDYFFYPGAAQKSIAATNFSGTPAYVLHGNTLGLSGGSSTTPSLRNMPDQYRVSAGGTAAGLAVLIKGAFTVTTPGEYSFSFNNSYWTSCNLSIDGVTVGGYECWSGGTLTFLSSSPDTVSSAYLLPGEHTLNVKLCYVPSGAQADTVISFWFRGVDANVRSPAQNNINISASGPYFYTGATNAGH